MIKRACECSIRVFMRCSFENDTSEVEDFDVINDEWLDISGIGQTRTKDLLVAIHNCTVRIFAVQGMIAFQMDYIKQYQEPYTDGFWFFKRHGHRLKWEADLTGFLKQLELVEIRERKWEAELDDLNKKLEQSTKESGKNASGNGRIEFVSLINDIERERRYQIDRDKTDMESFGLMVKDYFENRVERQQTSRG